MFIVTSLSSVSRASSLVRFRSNFQSCTFYNEPGVVSCGACGSTYVDLDAGGGAYDQVVQLSTRTPALLFSVPTGGPAAEPWGCPTCTFRNRPSSSRCMQCNTWKPAALGGDSGIGGALDIQVRVNSVPR